MAQDILKSVFEIGETITVEFKRCGNGIENDVYETVCSFLNRFGGDLFLGVLDDGKVCGVPEKATPDMVKNFISCVSNPGLFSPTVYLVPEIKKYHKKTIIHVHIPPSAEVHSYKKAVYDRVDDADVKVTATAQIAQMYIRKQEIFTEKKIYPYVKMEDLRLDLLPKLRIMAVNNSNGNGHPWSSLDDEEFLKSSRLFGTDRITGMQGYNLAAVMLLGKDDTIFDVAPAYMTDALLRRVNVDRYDDREIIQTNLIESYEQLMEFGRKHLPDKFFLEEDQRKNLRNIITREMIANTLIHREYTSSYQAKFVIEKDRMYVENANRASQHAVITLDNLEPNPKNPIIASFFRNIGYADQLGSGVRNLFKYSKCYSGKEPEFAEGDIFRIVVPLHDDYVKYTTQAMQRTTQVVQEPTQAMQNTTQAKQEPTQATENTTQAVQEPTQAKQNTTQAKQKPTQATENTTQAKQKTTQAVKNTTQAKQRTTQAKQEPTQAMQNTTQAKQEPTQATENTTQDPQDTTQLADRILLESNSEKDQIKRLMLYGIKMNEYMTKRNIVDLIRKEPEISQKQIAERLNLNLNTTKYYIRKLKESGIIERAGSPQKGKWIVREQEN
ncbi:MAG: winged helix-turn-helix transcriptional regulator [Lachnospiraceae bacterium]|nr:winged helix-turn-helix transcriptional regulator [Lachnospiraceae bacterium]